MGHAKLFQVIKATITRFASVVGVAGTAIPPCEKKNIPTCSLPGRGGGKFEFVLRVFARSCV
jgi:hypothetical protein